MDIVGYAVICENDCIADAAGSMPDSLKTEAEWAYFQAGLEASDVIVLGRKSHAVTPNPRARQRLVMTGRVSAPVWEDTRTVFWNPKTAPMETALAMFDGPASHLAVTGGRLVFDYFLNTAPGYTRFHLSRVKDVYIKNGIKVFTALEEATQTPESLLRAKNYSPDKWQQLDDIASVVSWIPR